MDSRHFVFCCFTPTTERAYLSCGAPCCCVFQSPSLLSDFTQMYPALWCLLCCAALWCSSTIHSARAEFKSIWSQGQQSISHPSAVPHQAAVGCYSELKLSMRPSFYLIVQAGEKWERIIWRCRGVVDTITLHNIFWAQPLCHCLSLCPKWRWKKTAIHLSKTDQRLAPHHHPRLQHKFLIKKSCSRKMNNDHLLSQHAVIGQCERGRDMRERRICENMWLKVAEWTERPWASAVKHVLWNVSGIFQGYTPWLCHFWASILPPRMTAINHHLLSDSGQFTVRVLRASGRLLVQQHWHIQCWLPKNQTSCLWWKDMFGSCDVTIYLNHDDLNAFMILGSQYDFLQLFFWFSNGDWRHILTEKVSFYIFLLNYL